MCALNEVKGMKVIMDDKYRLTELGIGELVSASKKLKAGEIKTGTLDKTIINKGSGTPQVRAKFVPDKTALENEECKKLAS